LDLCDDELLGRISGGSTLVVDLRSWLQTEGHGWRSLKLKLKFFFAEDVVIHLDLISPILSSGVLQR
jgi:hypothetical protein